MRGRVVEAELEATIPLTTASTWMTFGQDRRWRAGVAAHAEPGMKVLEVGCGPGSFAETIRNVELTCLDPSPEMLRVAKKRVDAVRAAQGESPAAYVEAIAESFRCPMPPSTVCFASFLSGIFKTSVRAWRKFSACSNLGGSL